jgi:hypothetical protein
MTIILLLTSDTLVFCQSKHIDGNDLFGRDMHEMPYRFGVLIPNQYECDNFSGYFVLTPLAIRIYLSQSKLGNFHLYSNMEEEDNAKKNLYIETATCLFRFSITRSLLSNGVERRLLPDMGNGRPGDVDKSGKPSTESPFYSISSYFPDTNVDCGRFSSGLFGNEHGLNFIYWLQNFDSSIKISTIKNVKSLEFQKNECITRVIISCFVKIDGKWAQIFPL